MKEEFPNAKWILALWRIYNAPNNDKWVNRIQDRDDKDELTPDILFQESFAGTMVSAPFVDDTNNFNSGVNITKDMAGITQPTLE
jgi:hypothetical protein